MRIAFDTNILLDAILNRPGRMDSLKLIMAAAEDQIAGIVSANSITDLYYLARKGIGDQGAREAVADILSIFDIASVDGDACAMALNTPMSDYEDAVLAVCAAKEEADYIVTNDKRFLKSESPVPPIASADLLNMIKSVFP